MSLSKKVIFLAVPFALSGCLNLEQMQLPQLPDITQPKEPISASLSKICSDTDRNPVSSLHTYKNKQLETTGTVTSISEGFNPQFRVIIKAGQTSIYAQSNNPSTIKHLSKGQRVKVKGTVYDLSTNYPGCTITLKDSDFIK